MVEYFEPLMNWLKEQNKGETCGWDGEDTSAPVASVAPPAASAAAPAASGPAPAAPASASASPPASSAIACPEGTEPRGDAPPRGREMFCARKGSGGAVRHGPFRSWSVGNKPEVEGEYGEGKMVGRWTLYHPNGNRESEGTFVDNRREGVWSFYDASGKKLADKTYKNGEEVK